MKKTFLFASFLLLYGCVGAQATKATGSKETGGLREHAAMIALPYAPEVVKQALSAYVTASATKGQTHATIYLLSPHTILVQNSSLDADWHFEINAKDSQHPNESLVYLILISFGKNHPPATGAATAGQDVLQAIAYLDTLSRAIRPFATDLQRSLQKKNLGEAVAKKKSLMVEGTRLAQQQKQLAANKDQSPARSYLRKQLHFQELVENNLEAQRLQSTEIKRQEASLAVWESRNSQQ